MSNDIELWRRLAAAGIVTGELPEQRLPDDPWYIAAVTGGAAWLAALFMLAFLGIALHDVMDSPLAVTVLGVLVSGAAIALLVRWQRKHFLSQLAMAFSLAGQALVLLGLLMPGSVETPGAWWLFALLQAIVLVIVPHPAHRVVATFACAMAILAGLVHAVAGAWFLPLLLAAFAGAEAMLLNGRRPYPLWHAMAIGLVLALFGSMLMDGLPGMFGSSGTTSAAWAYWMHWSARTAMTAVCIAAAALLVRDEGGRLSGRGGLALLAVGLLSIASWPVPAAMAAFVMLLLAFAAAQRVLAALTLLALLAALVHHYYQLDTTLLHKSAGLLLTGCVLLAARVALRKLLPVGEARDA